jgi:hypothetical protein
VNERPLDEIVAEAVDSATAAGVHGEDAVLERVLQDPDIRIVLDGYRMHDRAEGLEDVMVRDIRRKVQRRLESGPG